MKVLLINGSPRAKGNTFTALHEMERFFCRRVSKRSCSISGIRLFVAALDVTAARREGSVFLKTR